MTNRDDAIDDLKIFANYNSVAERGIRIKTARLNKVTWREIAEHLGMTEGGVHKAYHAYLDKSGTK